MSTGTRTSHSLSEELGSELVTDGGFAATNVTGSELVTNGDNEVAKASLTVSDRVVNGTFVQDIGQAHGGTNSTKVTRNVAGTGSVYCEYIDDTFTVISANTTYKINVWVYIPSGGTIATVGIRGYSGSAWYTAVETSVTDTWTELSCYFTTLTGGRIQVITLSAANTEFFYHDDLSIKKLTFLNWTEGTGWVPEVNLLSGTLTGKANKIAGTASNLEQDVSAVAGNVYRVVHTATRTAGSETPKVGGASGAARSSAATFTDNIGSATTTGNLQFSGDATFAGTVDTVSCKEIVRRGTPD